MFSGRLACSRCGQEVPAVPRSTVCRDCAERASTWAEETGAFDVSTLREPYRVEGKKTMMLEILEASGWEPPDAIVYPTGGGTGLIASWKVLGELETLGLCGRSTRLYSVQSTGCAPIVDA